jgi:hypothetical protein
MGIKYSVTDFYLMYNANIYYLYVKLIRCLENDLSAKDHKDRRPDYCTPFSVLLTGARFLLVDLGNVDVISSAGLRALHSIYKMFTLRDEEAAWHKVHSGEMYKSPYFKLACASSQVYNVLGMTGFLQNISIFPGVEEALLSFSS